MSGKGQSKLKLSGNGNECKPLFLGLNGAGKSALLHTLRQHDAVRHPR